MSRWSEKLGNSVNFASENMSVETNFMENFFINRAYQPKTDEERKEFEEFSFVISALVLAIYVALADEDVSSSEKERIIDEIMLQIKQHQREYEIISEDFGSADREIVDKLFEELKNEILNEQLLLKDTVILINKFYENNPYKKYYLLRLCYMVAYTKSKNIRIELAKVDQIAKMLHVEENERQRIDKEIKARFYS